MGRDEGLEPPFHDDKNGIFQLSLCYHLHQSLLCLNMCEYELKVIHIGFSELFLLTRLNVFTSACIDDSSFRCSPSAYLIRLAGFFVLRASFHQVTASNDALRLLPFPRHFFYRYVKELLLQSFPNLSRCKIVAARTTYFIRSWTYLCTV